MAEKKKYVYEVEYDTSGAVKSMNKLDESVDNVNKGVNNTEKSTGLLTKGFKGMGVALKAVGIGAIIGALMKLADVLSQNQKFADGFNKILLTGSTVINEALSALTPLVDAFQALIDLDFDRAGKALSELGNNALNFGKNIKQTVTDAAAAADEIVRLRNEVVIAEAQEQKLSLTYRLRAEQLRQIRDDESKGIEERIAANNRLGELLQKQENIRIANAQKRLDLARLELSANKDNIELQAAVINAEAEIISIQEETAGFRSEQLTNQNALLKEQREEQVLDLELLGATEIQIAEDIGQMKLDINDRVEKRITKQTEDALKVREGLSATSAQAGLAIAESVAGSIEALAGENAALAKAASYAQAVINVAQGVTAAIAQGGIAGIATGATVAAAGAIQIAKIASTPIPGESGGSSGGGVSAPTFSAPQFTLAGDDGTNQLTQAINNRSQAAVKAYVTTRDFNNAQSLERNIDSNSSFG